LRQRSARSGSCRNVRRGARDHFGAAKTRHAQLIKWWRQVDSVLSPFATHGPYRSSWAPCCALGRLVRHPFLPGTPHR
jgi:hypothetical protein